jgi:hypothetical protein
MDLGLGLKGFKAEITQGLLKFCACVGIDHLQHGGFASGGSLSHHSEEQLCAALALSTSKAVMSGVA